jgi:hypothetical protein
LVAWGNNQFIAVGWGGTILSSAATTRGIPKGVYVVTLTDGKEFARTGSVALIRQGSCCRASFGAIVAPPEERVRAEKERMSCVARKHGKSRE